MFYPSGNSRYWSRCKEQQGGVIVEFFLSLLILMVFLLYLFDVGQRIGQLAWANQITYIVSYMGSETPLEQRVFSQKNLVNQTPNEDKSPDYEKNGNIRDDGSGGKGTDKRPTSSENKTLIDAQNSFWKMSPYYDSGINSSSRMDGKDLEQTKVSGSSNNIWNPGMSAATTTEFNVYTTNNLNSLVTNSYLNPSNVKINQSQVLKYDWCGRLCNGVQCPQSNEVGYITTNGKTVRTFQGC